MNTFQEINTLRKEGRLDEAYHLAQQSLEIDSEDIWLKRAMGWVVYEYLDQSASNRDFSTYLDWLQQFSSLNMDSDEKMLYESVLWSVRKLLAETEGKSAQYDELFAILRSISFPCEGKAYSALLSASLKLDGKWENLHDFIDWWNLEHLSEEDYKEFPLENGRKMMSLAERAMICYAKNLLRSGDNSELDSFIPFLNNVVETHKEFVYPPYYLAKLYLKKGDTISAWNLLKQFATFKSKDFWIWQLLAETQPDEEVKLSFLCKALMCRSKEEMLVSLREQAALLFSKLGYLSEAKFEVLKAIDARKSKGWGVTANLRNLQVEKWFMQVEAPKDHNMSFYRQHYLKAERMVLGEPQKHLCLITYVNEAKQMVSFVTKEKRMGFFRIPKNSPVLRKDHLISFVAKEIFEDRPTTVNDITVVEGCDNPAFFRSFSGSLKKTGGFGMVGDVFVENKHMSSIAHGVKVKGVACISYDKKKERWGWRAVSIELES